MLKKLLSVVMGDKSSQRRADLTRDFIRREAQIGGQLFGPVPQGHRREFFCLDEHTWVWHEDWVDKQGVAQTSITRYDVKPAGIIKSHNGVYKPVSLVEAKRLYEAAKMYQQRVQNQIYRGIA